MEYLAINDANIFQTRQFVNEVFQIFNLFDLKRFSYPVYSFLLIFVSK